MYPIPATGTLNIAALDIGITEAERNFSTATNWARG
jgi:hypothetical protein